MASVPVVFGNSYSLPDATHGEDGMDGKDC